MLRLGLHKKSSVFYKLVPEQFYGKNNKANYKHEQTDPVNTMHVFYEGCFRTIRIWLSDV